VNAVIAVPSLTSDSHSRIVTIRAGAPKRSRIALADTGSVGPSTAPRVNATAHGSPAMSTPTTATPPTVASTRPMASSRIGPALARNSPIDDRNAEE
jgi:hypothetical protein